MASIYSGIRCTGSSLSRPDALANDAASSGSATTVGAAELAARQALEGAGLSAQDIDFLVIGTTSPDVVFPNAGCLLQERLGLRGCAAFSVEAGGAGFVYALGITDQFIGAGQARCALVVGAETRREDPQAPGQCVAAAGAAILEEAASPGVVFCHLGADRHLADSTASAAKSAFGKLRTQIKQALERQQWADVKINGLIVQQTDPVYAEAAADYLGIAADNIILSSGIDGDPAAATMPLALDRAIRDGRVNRGDLLLLLTLGGAVTWGAALIRL